MPLFGASTVQQVVGVNPQSWCIDFDNIDVTKKGRHGVLKYSRGLWMDLKQIEDRGGTGIPASRADEGTG